MLRNALLEPTTKPLKNMLLHNGTISSKDCQKVTEEACPASLSWFDGWWS